ncbi:serine/threonine-protein kinase OSR1 [Carica papaya]|uniref:serine/threonine-protein kinase OSR1 n=1 Tax=Carica papaya TaxID=3649 RepID=UPI000B8CAE3E|nr:serine/threonine-protein kinase OSR1 [Carica papaya]
MMEKKKYPIGPEHYTLYEEVGQGVSASVHRALCVPLNEIVAIKILDFERDNCDLNNISREAQTMILVDHPNVLKSHCSFVSDHNLWVVMPYMAGGSCLHILKAAYPDGFEEVVIATVLREVLKGLEYLHHHGHIHRDVKAGNILIDARGGIKLGDFGVSACLFDSGDRQRMRNTFVGTPCWYVLLMTLQNAPPGLDYERDKKFSKSFKQMIASCLVKDPSKRPSAQKLLKHSFFKQAKSSDYLARMLLEGLPALGDRMKALKRKEEDMLAQKKMPDGQKEEISQNEYKRGISGWNFNLEDMKAQASLIQDGEDSVSDNNQGGSSNSLAALDTLEKQPECQEDNDHLYTQPVLPPVTDQKIDIKKLDKSDDDSGIASPCEQHMNSSSNHDDHADNNLTERTTFEVNGGSSDCIAVPSQSRTGVSVGTSILPESSISPVKVESDKRPSQLQNVPVCNGAAAPPAGDEVLPELPSKQSKLSVNSDELDDKSKPPVVQQKGRFKVTSENVDLEKVVPSPILQKSHSMQVLTQHPASSLPATTFSSDATSSTFSNSSLLPMLNAILQTNILQRENILYLMKQISTSDSIVNLSVDVGCMPPNAVGAEKSLLEAAHDREKELLHEITELQWRLICAQEELQKYKTENAQESESRKRRWRSRLSCQSADIVK